MAVLAEGHNGVLEALLDVVGITRPRLIANATGQGFNAPYVFPLLGGQLVVHNPKPSTGNLK